MKSRTDKRQLLRLGRMASDIEHLAMIGVMRPDAAREACANLCTLFSNGYRMLPIPWGNPILIVAKKSGNCVSCKRRYRAGAILRWQPGSPVVQHEDCSKPNQVKK